MADISTQTEIPACFAGFGVQLLMRSSPSSQTRASSRSSSASFFSAPVRASSGSGAGRQQWWPSSFSTMIGSRSYRSSSTRRANVSGVSGPLFTTA